MKKEISIKNHMDELLRVNQFVEEIGNEIFKFNSFLCGRMCY